MESLLNTAAGQVAGAGILGLGWLLYLIERYYVLPKKDAQARDDLNELRADYKALIESFNLSLSQFTVVLEGVRENLRRMG